MDIHKKIAELIDRQLELKGLERQVRALEEKKRSSEEAEELQVLRAKVVVLRENIRIEQKAIETIEDLRTPVGEAPNYGDPSTGEEW